MLLKLFLIIRLSLANPIGLIITAGDSTSSTTRSNTRTIAIAIALILSVLIVFGLIVSLAIYRRRKNEEAINPSPIDGTMVFLFN
jgi:heme/copper-type cytochrome/quinol oxidase subunit 2